MTTIQFEPMSVGGILDTAFRLYRAKFARFLAITAIIQVPLQLLLIVLMAILMQVAVESQEPGAEEPAQAYLIALGLMTIPYVLLSMIAQQLTSAALLKGVSETYLGRDVSVGEAYRFVLPKLWTLIAAALLVGLVTGLGYMLCIVPGVIFSLWYALTTPAIVVENLRATSGMSRSKSLASGNLGKIFLVLFVIVLISMALSYAFTSAGGLAAGFLLADNPKALLLVRQFIQIIPQLLVMPLSAAATVLIYYDLRIRKEGFDLEMLAQRLGSERETADGSSLAM